VRFLLLLLLTLNLFAVDATLTIEKDVEQRARIGLEDGSAFPNERLFHLLVSDLKISGHFLVDQRSHNGDFDSSMIAPVFKGQEYVLKYRLSQGAGTKLTVKLLAV